MSVWVFLKAERVLHPLEFSEEFELEELAYCYDLNDMGVADVNDDRNYDIFTLNHSNRQLLMLKGEDGAYRDRLVELGLSQSKAFPGVEGGWEVPPIEEEGFYIYWDRGKLVLKTAFGFEVSGQVRLPRELKFDLSGEVTMSELGDHDIGFRFDGDGEIVISSWEYYFLPIFELDKDVSLKSVYVGPKRASPTQPTFELPEQDRHTMIWADFDGDGRTDVHIARGGDQGMLADTHPDAMDELYLFRDDAFVEVTESTGMMKNGMPARSAQGMDVDGDGKIDLYVVNGRAWEPNKNAPNQLFARKDELRFEEEAHRHGLDVPGDGVVQWIDCDNDGDMDMVWGAEDKLSLFRNVEGLYTEERLAPLESKPHSMTASDFDRDGDIDIFVVSEAGNVLLLGEAGGFVPVSPDRYGLPTRSDVANWVDYDNDGRVDLHALPQGLFKQGEDGTFARTGLLSLRISRKAFCSWFDADNDGDRDMLLALMDPFEVAFDRIKRKFIEPDGIFKPKLWRVYLIENNVSTKNNWLEVELVGQRGNRPAVGARVVLDTADGQVQSFVCHAEGSLHSQGHYRLYFGLGEAERYESLKVVWPNGVVEEFGPGPANQLLVLENSDNS
ncbi:CRTAC1 family protein [Pelagicoccus sp. SDUM812003]|uniref:CRTAC1 family protein n=1 Tax=Pelagicoccus sp. SDUM812003 TaxID=3041267 RepID=UPI0028108082|nr:CRTAC1 family protein [Pelagicoccus sp. SDUM812003]MDQ8203608.1 CRTAC1 family protein [Pelagicoccus sp. SDUM812003]